MQVAQVAKKRPPRFFIENLFPCIASILNLYEISWNPYKYHLKQIMYVFGFRRSILSYYLLSFVNWPWRLEISSHLKWLRLSRKTGNIRKYSINGKHSKVHTTSLSNKKKNLINWGWAVDPRCNDQIPWQNRKHPESGSVTQKDAFLLEKSAKKKVLSQYVGLVLMQIDCNDSILILGLIKWGAQGFYTSC